MTQERFPTEAEALHELAGTTYNIYAREYAYTPEGSEAFEVYQLDGQEYHVSENGRVFIRDYDDEAGEYKKIRIKDKAIISRLRKLAQRDRNVAEARAKLSDVLSEGDLLLQQVMRMHLEYNRGHVDSNPMEKEGIKFYSVGHNASHYFYLGVKDGKMYRCSIDGWVGSFDYYDALEAGEIDEEETRKNSIYLDEVDPDNLGYIGHF